MKILSLSLISLDCVDHKSFGLNLFLFNFYNIHRDSLFHQWNSVPVCSTTGRFSAVHNVFTVDASEHKKTCKYHSTSIVPTQLCKLFMSWAVVHPCTITVALLLKCALINPDCLPLFFRLGLTPSVSSGSGKLGHFSYQSWGKGCITLI